MTMSLADRSNKTQKIRMLPIAGKDPESQRSEMIKVSLKKVLIVSFYEELYGA